jgi:hypothetical protein
MSNRKFRDLPLYTGNTSGTYLILNNSSQTTTHKVTVETLFNGFSGTSINTGSFATTGSNVFKGNQVISGSLEITGTTTLGGNIVPKTARGATLGTLSNPFADIFVSSGSINIAGIVGQPNTTLSNVSGNILISAGGMQLIGSGAFNAATGSFQFISGSMQQVGDYHQTGDYELFGNKSITGSLTVSGSQTLIGIQILRGDKIVTGSINISGSQNFIGDQTLVGNKTITGSLNISGSLYKNGNKQFNYGQWCSLQTQSGSANTAYPMKLETQIDGLSGMYVGNNGSGVPTRIYVQNTGLYNIQFSTQLHTTSNEAVDFSIWFAMTGSAIDNSNTDFSIEKVAGGGFQVGALNFLTPISSGSYVEIYWSKTTANGQLQAKGLQSTPARPATPSVIVTLTQIA